MQNSEIHTFQTFKAYNDDFFRCFSQLLEATTNNVTPSVISQLRCAIEQFPIGILWSWCKHDYNLIQEQKSHTVYTPEWHFHYTQALNIMLIAGNLLFQFIRNCPVLCQYICIPLHTCRILYQIQILESAKKWKVYKMKIIWYMIMMLTEFKLNNVYLTNITSHDYYLKIKNGLWPQVLYVIFHLQINM